MRDPRVTALAQILVRHSTKVSEGDVCTIEGESAAEPLLQAVYEEVLEAGGNPIVNMALEGQSAAYFEHASDKQLEWISPVAEWAVENADVRIAVMASQNTRALSQVPPERQATRQAATQRLMKRAMERSAEGSYRWALTLFPTHAYASEAGMGLPAYEDFYYGACLATDADPVGAWTRTSEETKRLADWIQGRSEVHVTGDGTDLRLGIADRTFIAADGKHNMPDGEFFTGPVEDSAEGEITFHLPASYAGREVAGVRFRFEGGKVVDASAEKGEEFLIEMLDTDDGARRLGELGIGTNYGITAGTGEILLDEKIGGTVHLAVGRSYPETGGVNESAIHWDMICDLRKGGQIEVDGETLAARRRICRLNRPSPEPSTSPPEPATRARLPGLGDDNSRRSAGEIEPSSQEGHHVRTQAGTGRRRGAGPGSRPRGTRRAGKEEGHHQDLPGGGGSAPGRGAAQHPGWRRGGGAAHPRCPGGQGSQSTGEDQGRQRGRARHAPVRE